MVFTRRLYWLVGFGIVPLLLSTFVPALALLGVVGNLVVTALVVTDYLLGVSVEDAIQVHRVVDAALVTGREVEIALIVENRVGREVRGIIRDEPPAVFVLTQNDQRQHALNIGPRARQTFTYRVTPPARGDFSFGDIYLRIVGPLGLVVRQGRSAAAMSVAVFPDVQADGVDLLLRRAQRTRAGMRRARTVGIGRVFSSLREYTPDDEYRVVDWKATARSGKVIARTFEAERSQDVLLLLDLGRLMRQEVGCAQKLDPVIRAALTLARAVADADDRVGLLTFTDGPQTWLPPRRGRAVANDILQALYASRAEPVESDYRGAFRFLSARWRKRSLAVLFTDLSDPETSAILLAEIAQLARAHLVVCVVVRDALIDERARQSPATTAAIYEKVVAGDVLRERSLALSQLRQRGVLVVDAVPEALSASLVERYLMVRDRALL
jgi:uncharacterized protein (DUF58 family)